MLQFLYKRVSKHFSEVMFSTEAVKTGAFKAFLKCWSRLYLKYSYQYFQVC